MAPRVQYAKSQELVYKKVARGYKLVSVDNPRKPKASFIPKQAEASAPLPPIVSGPSDGDGGQPFPDTSFPGDYDVPRAKKSGKVGL